MSRIRQATIGVGLVLIAASLMAGLPASARAPYFDWTFDPVAFDPPQPVRFELDNGLVVYFLANEELPVITMTALTHTGEVYAPAAKTGLGEITGEVLVTGGTESRTPEEVDEALEFLGIRWSGSIGDESGSFAMHCLAKDFATALDLLADLLQHPGFDEAK
ncbi:MAG TPA: insulinase family protein, partial [Acidobacteriota bacterium]|nr:insulinase family protein [Acidobacteriota bacterium]